MNLVIALGHDGKDKKGGMTITISTEDTPLKKKLNGKNDDTESSILVSLNEMLKSMPRTTHAGGG